MYANKKPIRNTVFVSVRICDDESERSNLSLAADTYETDVMSSNSSPLMRSRRYGLGKESSAMYILSQT